MAIDTDVERNIVEIKEVPEGCETEVRRMACVAIERWMRRPPQDAESFTLTAEQIAINSVYVANGLPPRFLEDLEEPILEVPDGG